MENVACQNNCESCVLNPLRKAIELGGSDPAVNRLLHTTIAALKVSMIKNKNGLPMSNGQKSERMQQTAILASHCRDPRVSLIAQPALQKTFEVVTNSTKEVLLG